MSQYCIVLKFDGYWVEVKNQVRKKYEGGKQKTLKFDKDLFNLFVIKEEIMLICPWLKDHAFELHSHIPGTSPKQYKLISTDFDLMQVFQNSNEGQLVEVVVSMQNDGIVVDGAMCSLNTETKDSLIVKDCNEDIFMTEKKDNSLLYVGSYFQDATSFKQTLRTEAIISNFEVKIKASDKTRVIAVCAHRGCPWRIRATLCADGHTFQVRKLETTHLCPRVNKVRNNMVTSSWVALQIENIVKKNPDIPPKLINSSLESAYGLSLPYMQLWRSRELARDLAFRSADENYKWVPTLKSELIRRNPGSHITYMYDMVDNSFMRFYASFKVCIDGFLVGCRPLVGLDACHLKSKYLSVLLSASSLDGNNELFTIAFAVVEAESKNTWEWFLHNLDESFTIEIAHLAFISNMEKGVSQAIISVFPNAEHRVCLRHLWKNVKKLFYCNGNHHLKSLVWTAANAYTKIEFERKKQEIFNISPQIHAYLISLPYKWSRSEFSVEIKNYYNTNKMTELFNSWIGEVQGKPVVDLIDMIRGMLMEQRAKRKITSVSWRGHLTPFAEEHIKEISTRKEQFIIRYSTPFKAEIEGNHRREEVDIMKKECTCNFWQISGLPCIHAVAFLGTKDLPLWHTYVDEHYHKVRYCMAYEGAIATLPDKNQWIVVDDGINIGVPKILRPRDRPKKRKIKSFLEGKNCKSKIFHKCGKCGLCGHHRSTCKNLINSLTDSLPPVEANVGSSNNIYDTIGVQTKLPIKHDGVVTENEDYESAFE